MTVMNDREYLSPPAILTQIQLETQALGFQLASDSLTGSLLRTLAATKPAGRLLELGTGTGVSAAWILDGMDQDAQLISVDNDALVASIAKKYLESDRRVTFQIEDAAVWLAQATNQQFDFIFADAWVGKYSYLQNTLRLLKPGGLYVIDDMLPQPTWTEEHTTKASELIAVLESKRDLFITKMTWSSGIVLVTKKAGKEYL